EVLRVLRDELIDGPGARDEDGDARLAPAPRAAHLLPRRGDGARVAGQDGRVQTADIDSQLERVRAHDAEDVAAAEAGLDVASLRGQVSAAIAADAFEWAATLAKRLAQAGQQQLDRDARLGEDDRLPPGTQE